jgi:ATP-dependent DNA helicase DinG
MIEAEVHSQLLAFIKQKRQPFWPHHLTMGRLIARTLRLGKSALIQTGTTNIPYHLSYLTVALLGDWSVILVIPKKDQFQLLNQDIPQLQQWLKTNKPVITDDFIPPNFQGIILTTPQNWLQNFLENKSLFPLNLPTIIDQADYLEEWVIEQLTSTFLPSDWDNLRQKYPPYNELIFQTKIQLTEAVFAHPPNPYQCHLLDQPEQEIFQPLFEKLNHQNSLQQFWQNWQNPNFLHWVSLNREKGQFTLHLTPVELASSLASLWLQQPLVIIGRFLDSQKSADIYRQQLGIGDLLCLKFSPSRETQQIQLYLPERLPLPNTPEFQNALMRELRFLLTHQTAGFIVLLVEDTPLKKQVGAILAAEFGSKVQVETNNLSPHSILVTGGDFWHENQENLPPPQLLVMATLPIPSLENPLVASKVGYYKRNHRDWFHHYLLPTALREIQRSVISVRQCSGMVAILDNRINHRSYGKKILSALEPYVRINYLEKLTID